MANPNAVLQTEFSVDGNGTVNRSIDPGALEPDDFIINDVALRIAPESISVHKESFNHEWHTLRTQSARKAKSGYGLARVAISTIFRVSRDNGFYDAVALSRVVAGLRATPFCVVHNNYLDSILGRPDDETPVASGQSSSSKPFQPIMLALASMTFSTMGHEGKPDCIRADFDFIWFNYLPYTKHVAFKTGTKLDKPGFPWQSKIWKAFYEPFLYEQSLVGFPHEINSPDRVTEFMWREFLLIPKGNPLALKAANDLANALKNRPSELVAEFENIIQQGTLVGPYESSNLRNPDNINEGTLDTLYRVAVKKGLINPADDVRNALSNIPGNTITNVASAVLSPILRKLYGKNLDNVSTNIKSELDVAAALLSERLKKIESIKERGDVVFSTIDNDGKFTQLINSDALEGKQDGSSSIAGGLNLFGRKRFLRIAHSYDSGGYQVNGAIIQQVVVSFRNILATIPMLAYRYPTVQHVGSIDAEVNIVINAENSAAEQIRKMYDRIETGALRYKQVPAGFTNLNINNDFLKLFGIKEFLTERLDINTIPGQPARSMINFTLCDAGLTSQDKDQEVFQQEFVQADTSISKNIWSIFEKNIIQKQGTSGSKSIGFWRSTFTDERNDVNKPTDLDYYRRKIHSIKRTGNDQLYANLLHQTTQAFNEFLEKVHKSIFNEDYIEGSKNWALVQQLTEDSTTYGYLPGINWIQRSIEARNKAFYEANEDRKVRKKNLGIVSDKSLKKINEANVKAKNVTGNASFAAKSSKSFGLDDRINRLNNEMGLSVYQQKVNALLQEVTQKYLSLDRFQHLLKKRDELGLNKGLMAHNDFRKQLTSVAKFAEGANRKQSDDLLKYDPDCYFYYPFLNGGSNSPLNGIIDPYYLTTAEIFSKKIHNDAVGKIETFFTEKYQPRMDNPANKRPYDTLVRNTPEPLYSSLSFTNSSQSEKIQKTVVPDAESKIHTNWYPSINPGIKSNNICEHSTDIEAMWNGVSSDPNGNAASGQRESASPSPSQDKGRGQGKWILEESSELLKRNVHKKVGELRIEAQPIFERVLDDMVKQGFDPVMGNVYRTYASQREKIINGYSKPSATRLAKQWIQEGRLPQGTSLKEARRILIDRGVVEVGSYHIWGLAADIRPRGYGYKKIDKRIVDFLKALRATARKHGLNCGGYWKQRNKSWAQHGIGWDPWHCQLDKYQGNRIPNNWRVDLMAERRAKANNVQRYSPPSTIQKQLDRQKTAPISRDVTSTISSPLRLAVQDFERDLYNGQAQSMMRAYPAFKLYFIEDDSGDERKRLQFDDFFSYQSVQSIRVIRSRKIAADFCEIYLTNISGVLSNRKFRNSRRSDQPFTKTGELGKENVARTNTSEENPIASLLLQQGMNIHLKLGYTNDPSRMETTFNGVITGVQFSDSDDLVRIVAQSYAIEMIQDLKGVQKPIKKTSSSIFGWDKWGFGSNATTGRILEEMMAEPELLHFGRWTATGGGANPSRELLTQRWTYQPQPQDDNIFAPSVGQDLDLLGEGLLFKNLKYIIYRTTIWDIFQEMTLRHPNFIASPVPYKGQTGERMTMFFGLPNQLYFARDPNAEEQIVDEKLKKIQKEAESGLGEVAKAAKKKQLIEILKKKKERGTYWAEPYRKTLKPPSDNQIEQQADGLLSGNIQVGFAGGSNIDVLLKNSVSAFYREKRLQQAREAGYVKPFRNYHLITSSQHLVQNNIKANARDVANTIVIKYGKDVEVKDSASGNKLDGLAIKGEEQEFTLKLDAALPTEEIRTQMGQFVNVTHEELAKRYALGLLLRNIKDIYKGEIVVIGNPSVKPYDITYLFDEYSDMIGAFEVEEVQHIFDQQHGFRTEIKPDMFAQAQEFSLLSSAEALGVVMEGALRKLGNSGNGGALLKFFAPNPYIMGHGINMFGGFLAQKLINFTQLAQPVVMSPLLHHGRMFTGGIPIRKIPTSPWTTMFGNWTSSADAGFSDWLEDIKDETLGWLKTRTLQNSVGNFFNTGGDSPE